MSVGFQNIAADGVLHAAGVPVTIYSIHIISTGTPAVVNLRSGSTVAGTVIIKETGTASTGLTFNYNGGITFPSGCYVDIDANTTSVMVAYEKV